MRRNTGTAIWIGAAGICPGLAGNVENVLCRQEAGRRKPRQNADTAPAGGVFDDGHAIGKERGITAKLVDQEAADQRPVFGIENGVGSDKAGDDTATVDVANNDHRQVRGNGKAHIRDVAGAKIDLGGAAGTFDDHKVRTVTDHLENFREPAAAIRPFAFHIHVPACRQTAGPER